MKLRILVTGAGGFIGDHLIKRLKADGHWVRGVDLRFPEFRETEADEFLVGDLRYLSQCSQVVKNVDYVFNLAADMGGIGYITSSHAKIARNNTLINLYMLEASREAQIRRFLFSSSACVYPSYYQDSTEVRGLREEDAIPADPEAGYGWEKLYAEQLCTYYKQDFNLDMRIVRFHNVYGPFGTYTGGKEKAPAALCRKIAEVEDGAEIEVWGDGHQRRSFMYISDCVEGLVRLMMSDYDKPLNLGTDYLVSINELVDVITEIAQKRVVIKHNLQKPQGVRGRNSDNSNLRKVLGWEPKFSLNDGLFHTYHWINGKVSRAKSCLTNA